MRLALSSRTIEFVCVALILCCSSVLILSNLGNQYLWQDEAQTALIAKTVLTHGIPLGFDGRHSFSQELGAEYGKNYVWKWHTWLPFYVLAAFFKVFGINTYVARLPFVLFGIATILLTYYVGKSLWKSRRAALLGATVLLLTVPFLLLARQCRYYSPAAFFALLGLYGYLNLVERRKHASVTFVLSATLLFHTFYVYCAALLATIILHALLFHRDRIRTVALVLLAVVVINAPWIIWLSSMGYVTEYGSSLLDPAITVNLGGQFIASLKDYVFPPLLLLLPLLVGAVNWLRHKRVPRPDGEVWRKLVLILLFGLFNIGVVSMSAPAPFFRYLAPVIPACALVTALILNSSMKLHPAIGIIVLAILGLKGLMPGYLHEITHDYDGPIEGIVKHLNEHGDEDDVVAITYGDLPLKFYTNMRIVGGLTGEDPAPAKEADWVIVRRYAISEKDWAVRSYLIENVPWGKYEPIKLDYPDIPFQNRESPEEHNFMTVTDEYPVVIFRRVAD